MHEIADSGGNDDGLVGGDSPEAPPVEMVEVGVGDEHQINVGQMVMCQAGMAQSPGDKQPIGPVGVHQNVSMGSLDQERGVADPGDAELSRFEPGKNRGGTVAMAPSGGKKSGQKDIGDKAVGPTAAR